MSFAERAPWPAYSEEEVEAVAAVLRSNKVNYWTGQESREFEREFASWAHAAKAIAVSNGTVALDLALQGLGIGAANGGSAHDEVIVTPRTFIASVSCVANAGAVPVFADVERDSGNLSSETITPFLTDRTKAVIAVHLAGWPVDLAPMMDLARAHGIAVIEDCAQAHGTLYRGRPVGAIGDVGAWSFCQDKVMTTGGEGGMVTTDDAGMWDRMWSFKDHGKSWTAVYEREHPPGFRWLHESTGTNWRMMEIQAVLGRIQLRRMEEWTRIRRRNAQALKDALRPHVGDNGFLRLPEPDEGDGSLHGHYRLYAYVRPEALPAGWDRDRLVQTIVESGVPCFQGSCSEVYLEKAFDGTGWRPASPLPNARDLGDTSMMFLVHPTIDEELAGELAAKVARVLENVTG